MSYIVPPPIADGTPLDLQLAVDEEDNSVYIKISGFDNHADATEYSKYLGKALPLFLFDSDVKH